MAKSIHLNVDIKTKYQQQLEKVRGISEKLASEGGYTGHLGPERLNKVNSLISSLEKTLNLDNISLEQLTELKNNFKELFGVLETVSNGVTTLTPKMKQLTENLRKAQENLEQAEKERNNLVSQGKLGENGKFVNLEGFNDQITKLGAYRVRKDGQKYKTSMSDFATVYDRVVNKKETVLTADGRDITTTDEWKKMVAKLAEYNIKLDEANKVLADKTKAEKTAITKLKKQADLEKDQGITGVDITQDIAQTRSDTNSLTNKLYQLKAEQTGTENTVTNLTTSIQKQQTVWKLYLKLFVVFEY